MISLSIALVNGEWKVTASYNDWSEVIITQDDSESEGAEQRARQMAESWCDTQGHPYEWDE